MTREEVITALDFLNRDKIPTIEIFIFDQPEIRDDGPEFTIYKGRMHQDLPNEIKETFYPKISKTFIKREYDLMDYNPAIVPDRNVIWQYDSKIVPFYRIVQEKLLGEMDYYNSKTLTYSDIWAVWIKLTINGCCYYLIKKITPSKTKNGDRQTIQS